MNIFLFYFSLINAFCSLDAMEVQIEKTATHTSITDVDTLSCQLSIASHHLYAQWLGKEPLDITKACDRHRSLFGFGLSYNFPALPHLTGWEFEAITGHLGTYLTYVMGYENTDFFGFVGYHADSNTLAVVFRGSEEVSEYFWNKRGCVRRPYFRTTLVPI